MLHVHIARASGKQTLQIVFICIKITTRMVHIVIFHSYNHSQQIQLSKAIPSSLTGEEQIVVVPILHEIQNNTVQQPEVARQTTAAGSSASLTHAAIVSATLRRWSEVTPRTGECTIFPAVLELARNLDIPP